MSMSKQDFVALADAIREHNHMIDTKDEPFTAKQLDTLAYFCRQQNSAFLWDRWMDYVAGKCGKNGGAVKKG